MENKKAQVTIFIILAILIVGIVALFFTLRGTLQIPAKPTSSETAQIQNFVQECLDNGLESVVFRIGENGGYYFPTRAPATTPVLEVPYYIKNNQNLMPSKEQIQDEISRYVSRELIFCVGDFDAFPEYKVTKGKILAETIIESERVLIDISYQLSIKRGNSVSKLEDFQSEVPVRLGVVYDAVEEFIGQDLQTPEGVCISCLFNISKRNGFKSAYPNYDSNTYIFIIEDPQSKINKKEFIYVFANEY